MAAGRAEEATVGHTPVVSVVGVKEGEVARVKLVWRRRRLTLGRGAATARTWSPGASRAERFIFLPRSPQEQPSDLHVDGIGGGLQGVRFAAVLHQIFSPSRGQQVEAERGQPEQDADVET